MSAPLDTMGMWDVMSAFPEQVERAAKESASLIGLPTHEDIEMSAREHGIDDLKDVRAAILERDGSISIIPTRAGESIRTQRRIRQLRNRP